MTPTAPRVDASHDERGRGAGLNADRIARAALDLVDRDGLEALSMRHLGAELGVVAMSLYNHLHGRAAVAAAVVGAVISEVALPDPAEGDWPARMTDMARSFRQALLSHPKTLPLFVGGSAPVADTEALKRVDAALGILRTAGLGEVETVHVYRIISGFVLGFVLQETANVVSVTSDPTGREMKHEATGATTDLPWLNELATHLLRCDNDLEFELGLAAIINGLAQTLEVREEPTRRSHGAQTETGRGKGGRGSEQG